MKSRIPMLFLCALFASAASAQKAPSQVTDAQIKSYKANALKQCTEAGKAQKDAPEKVNAFCKCMVATLEKNVSQDEWKQLAFYSKERRAADEINVLGPHRAKIKECSAPKS